MSDGLKCAGVLELVEPIAAGDLAVDDRLRAHLESCPRCASALASARRIEAALADRPAPATPPRFTGAVLARIRRDRWLSEQRVDRIFNLAVATAVLLMVGGVVGLFNVDRVVAAAAALVQLLDTAVARRPEARTPQLAAYVGSIGLFISVLATWWWAERRLSL
jgi:anti-sigma factor RsiW